jgi:hypothetical protein
MKTVAILHNDTCVGRWWGALIQMADTYTVGAEFHTEYFGKKDGAVRRMKWACKRLEWTTVWSDMEERGC